MASADAGLLLLVQEEHCTTSAFICFSGSFMVVVFFFVGIVDFLSISVPLADKPHLTMALSEERSNWAEEGTVF